jgi:PAS domain S-box-containing protein
MEFSNWLGYLQYVPKWAELVGFLILCGGAWRFVLLPLGRGVRKVDQVINGLSVSLPILIDIAKEFKPNGGNSLRDVVDRIEERQAFCDPRHCALYSQLNLAVFEANEHGAYKFVSTRWCELTGLIPQQASGDGWINSIHPDDRERVMKEWRNSVAEQREFTLNFRIVSAHDKSVTEAHGHAFPAHKGSGRIVGFVGTLRKM